MATQETTNDLLHQISDSFLCVLAQFTKDVADTYGLEPCAASALVARVMASEIQKSCLS